MYFILDLDQTLIDSSKVEHYRNQRNWNAIFQNMALIKAYDHVDLFLSYLKSRNYKTALVTSSPRHYCQKVIQKYQWTFDSIICFHDTQQHKPSPEPIQLALSKLRVHYSNYQNTYSLGDKNIDIIASKKAGVKSVACTWGTNNLTPLIEAQPDIIINDIMELFQKIYK